jgi:hypothetical protein
MKNINQWTKRINSASDEELEIIESEWKEEGRKYNPSDWHIFWRSFADRQLILNGHKLTDPAF